MIIGCVQTSPEFGDKEANRRAIETLIDNRRADLWVMPELALTGYEFRGRAEAADLAEEIPHGRSVRWLEDFCAMRHCHAVLGLAEREKERVYNTAIMVGPQGYIGKYRKLHLFDKEFERFDKGDLPLPVFDLGTARVGVMICFDWRFPEAARTLALAGAQLIAHPSNLVKQHCQAAMVTRALENRVFTITANRVGTEERDERRVTFTGESVLISPNGGQLAMASLTEPDVLRVEMDPRDADNKMVNAYNSVLADRRTEYYRR